MHIYGPALGRAFCIKNRGKLHTACCIYQQVVTLLSVLSLVCWFVVLEIVTRLLQIYLSLNMISR